MLGTHHRGLPDVKSMSERNRSPPPLPKLILWMERRRMQWRDHQGKAWGRVGSVIFPRDRSHEKDTYSVWKGMMRWEVGFLGEQKHRRIPWLKQMYAVKDSTQDAGKSDKLYIERGCRVPLPVLRRVRWGDSSWNSAHFSTASLRLSGTHSISHCSGGEVFSLQWFR